MNDRLSYYTSIDSKVITSLVLPFSKVDYYTSLQSTDIAINNLKKLNNRLDENNIVTLAYLANNPHINNEDREKYEKQLKNKVMKENEIYSKYINDIIRRDEDSSTNQSECHN